MTKIRPLADRVVLKAIREGSENNASAIYLPEEKNKARPFVYEVVAIGPWTEKHSITVKIWEKVLAWQYAGDEIQLDWEEFKVLGIEYVLGIVE